MRRPRIVTNWRSRLKDYSSAALLAAGALQAVWLQLTDQRKAELDPALTWLLTSGVMWVIVFGIIGKFIVQGSGGHDGT